MRTSRPGTIRKAGALLPEAARVVYWKFYRGTVGAERLTANSSAGGRPYVYTMSLCQSIDDIV